MTGHLLDIVDENDNIVGAADMDIAHRGYLDLDGQVKGYWHRGAGALLFTDTNKENITLFKRGYDVTMAGIYCHPGGHLQRGQSYEEGIMMELGEEVFKGIRIPKSGTDIIRKSKLNYAKPF